MSVLIDLKTGSPADAGAQYQTAGYALAFPYGDGGLTFDEASHVYRLPDGTTPPSVTGILKATGVSTDFEDLSLMSGRISQAIALKRDIGVQVHAAAHYYDDNDLNIDTLDPQVRPYLDAWATFRENYPRLRPATRERRVYHPGLRYAGTLDGIFLTGDEVEPTVTERWSVQLTPGTKVPYRITEYTDWNDGQVWQAIVATYYAQRARRAA